MASTLPRLPIFKAIAEHDPESTVVVHSASGRRFTYGQLLGDVAAAKDKLLKSSRGKAMDGERIAFIVGNSYDYVGAQLALLPYWYKRYILTVRCDYSDTIELLCNAQYCFASVSSIPGKGAAVYPRSEPGVDVAIEYNV